MASDGRSIRERFFGAFVTLATGRPWLVLGVLAALMAVGLGFGTQLELSTSRYAMVRDDDPYQARLDAFFERFGYPDGLVFVIRGGTVEQRRAAAQQVVDLGEAEEAFRDRVMGRLDADHLAELLFLFEPDALGQLGEFSGDRPVADVVESGLPGLVGAVDQQLVRVLDGDLPAEAADADAEHADEALGRLGDLADLLASRLEGKDLRGELAELAVTAAPPDAESPRDGSGDGGRDTDGDSPTHGTGTGTGTDGSGDADAGTGGDALGDGETGAGTGADALDDGDVGTGGDGSGNGDSGTGADAPDDGGTDGDTDGDADGAREAPFEMAGLDAEGFLESRNGEFLIVAYLPRVTDAEMKAYAPLVSRAREIANEVESASGGDIDVMLTGLPVLMIDEDTLVGRGLMVSGIGTGFGVFLILALAYRSIRQSIMALAPIGVGMCMALGATAVVYGRLNPITSAMFAVMLGLGIDFSVHLIGRYHECLRELDGDRVAAVRAALVKAGPGIVTGAITTSFAFLSVATADFTAYAELGTVVAVGLVLMLFCVLVLVPIFANWKFVPDRAPPVLPGVVGLTRFVRRGTWPLLVGGVIVAAIGAVNFTNVHFNYRYLDFLPQSVESSKALHVIESDGAMNPMMGYLGVDDIESARQKAAALRAKDAVGEVQSPSDLLPPLGEDDRLEKLRDGMEALGRRPDFDALEDRKGRSAAALLEPVGRVIDDLDELAFVLEQSGRSAQPAREAKAQFQALETTIEGLGETAPARIEAVERQLAGLLRRAWTTAEDVAKRGHYEVSDLPPVFRNRHAALDDSGQVAVFVVPKDLVWSEPTARAFAEAVTDIDPSAAGHAISMHVHNEMILHDFRRAAIIAFGIVLVLLFIDFRRIDDTLLAIVPVTVGWLWMILIMALVPLTLNLANIIVLPLVFGVGIDAGVHMVHRTRQSARRDDGGEGDGGADGVATLEDLLQGTGASVMLASITTMVGFAGLILPDHGGMKTLGLSMVLGTGCCLVATVLVLPSVLVLLGRAK